MDSKYSDGQEKDDRTGELPEWAAKLFAATIEGTNYLVDKHGFIGLAFGRGLAYGLVTSASELEQIL